MNLERITPDDAKFVLFNLDKFVLRFEIKTGLKITNNARKIIEEKLLELIPKEKLN